MGDMWFVETAGLDDLELCRKIRNHISKKYGVHVTITNDMNEEVE